MGRYVSRFSLCTINLSRNKYFCCGLKKVVAKSRAWVYFEQQILVLLLVFHQTRNLPWIHTKQINQSARCISSTLNKCFFATCLFLRGNLRIRLVTQRKSIRKFNLRPLHIGPTYLWQNYSASIYLIHLKFGTVKDIVMVNVSIVLDFFVFCVFGRKMTSYT